MKTIDHFPDSSGLASTKYGELESIRGVAALLVVLFHLPKWNPVLDIGIINNSYLMVELFFVLSGFVIFNAYRDKISNVRDLTRFQFLRFGRLYPVHLLFLFAFVLIECSKYVAEHKFGLVGPNTSAFQVNNFKAFVQNLFLVSGLLPTEKLTFNGPSWSICVEFYTYLAFALIVLYSGKARDFLMMGICGTALILMGTNSTHGFDQIFQCLAGFFLGCLTAIAVSHIKFRISGLIALATLISIAVFLQLKTSRDADLVIYPLSALLIASLVRSKDSCVKWLLNLRGLTSLGAVSYSLYMCHASVEWAANQAVRVLLKRPEFIDAYGNSTPRLNPAEALIVTTLIVLTVLAISAISYRLIESPGRARSRTFAQKWL